MPFALCPICGCEFHILPDDDVARWYADFHPTLSVGSLVPSVCFDCWDELTLGDIVEIRQPDSAFGPEGTIRSIARDPKRGGEVYFVLVHEISEERAYARLNLRKKTRDAKLANDTPGIDKHDDYF